MFTAHMKYSAINKTFFLIKFAIKMHKKLKENQFKLYLNIVGNRYHFESFFFFD